MEVFNPQNKTELATCLPLLKPGAVIAGGCTDLSVRFLKTPLPNQLLNVSLVSELKGIRFEGGCLHLGAATTFTELEETALPDGFTALTQAASCIGSKQIRNMATIGGNIMNASPASDLMPCLFLFGASVEIMKPDGSVYERPIEDTVVGAGKTALVYNAVLTAVKIPVPQAGGLHSAFVKLGFRQKVTISRIGIAMSVYAEGGQLENVRFFMGAVAPVPVRVCEAEKILLENEWNEDTCEKLAAFLSDRLNQTVPEEFDRDYKTLAIRGAVHDIMQMLPLWGLSKSGLFK
jgi:carbon-monoxide dehydrogenase medium subunit